MAVNWALGLQQGPNAGEAFAQAFQQGQQTQRQNVARNALAVLAQDPNNQQALGALAKADPETAMQWRAQQAQLVKEQLAQHQDNILKGAEIIRQFAPKDQASYSQALAAAQAAGIDISQVPQQFNQSYVDGVLKLADALKPQAESDIVNVPYQAGGGVLQVNKKTGEIRPLVVPNPGTQQAGAPVAGQPLTDADILRMRGGQAASPPATFP
jgi:hypothetical protein